ncbi:Sugar transporter ERD6 14 isoform 1 [Hibiscus syriacus]|uniref:Sugar transporter ERD6 14 isoform 1 n=1 Tax=Hibiscus syriacus TaxID=106335 RepID=A0A6A3B0F9_HIBSY|nr:Sugar transporter ERD6 14 isoform 1 [Hibiscus syriacus]
MADSQDIEKGSSDSLFQPFIQKDERRRNSDDNGSLFMVLVSTFVAVMGSFEFGSSVGYSSPTQQAIMEELGMSSQQFSVFGSILTIGAMVGSISCGRAADMLGRKGTMKMSSIISIAGWLIIYLSLVWTCSSRFRKILTGYGIGAGFIAEITPTNLRGALLTVHQVAIASGLLVAYTVGAFVSWRTVALTGKDDSMCSYDFRALFIPESPRWLVRLVSTVKAIPIYSLGVSTGYGYIFDIPVPAMVGCQDDFIAQLHKLRGDSADVSREAAEIQDSLATLHRLPKATVGFVSKNKLTLELDMVFQQFSGYNGVVIMQTKFLHLQEFLQMLEVLYACSQIIVLSLGAVIIDRVGRRPLLMNSNWLLIGVQRSHNWHHDIYGFLLSWIGWNSMDLYSLSTSRHGWQPGHWSAGVVLGLFPTLSALMSWTSHAFNFIKSSEFYSPPPPAPSSTVSTPRPTGEADVPSSSAVSTSASRAAAGCFIIIEFVSQSQCYPCQPQAVGIIAAPGLPILPCQGTTKNFKLRCVMPYMAFYPSGYVWRMLFSLCLRLLKQRCFMIALYYVVGAKSALTTVRHVNKTNVVTLGSTFGSLSSIMDASMEDCSMSWNRRAEDAEPISASEVIEADKDTEGNNGGGTSAAAVPEAETKDSWEGVET